MYNEFVRIAEISRIVRNTSCAISKTRIPNYKTDLEKSYVIIISNRSFLAQRMQKGESDAATEKCGSNESVLTNYSVELSAVFYLPPNVVYSQKQTSAGTGFFLGIHLKSAGFQ